MATSLTAVGSIHWRKQVLRLAAVAGAVAVAFIAPRWPFASPARTAIEWSGLLLVLVCIAGRTWCALYISGRKIATLVDRGPYSVSRNPLYVFSTIGAAGVGALFGSLTLAILAAALTMAVLARSVREEEAVLARVHGEAYRAYRARVPRFWPRFSAWQEAETVTLRPAIVARSFLDSALFLAAVPLARGIEVAQLQGWIEPLFRLP
jgi:protein-S-isoprenylcysteine O-methyltransferase Ste14